MNQKYMMLHMLNGGRLCKKSGVSLLGVEQNLSWGETKVLK